MNSAWLRKLRLPAPAVAFGVAIWIAAVISGMAILGKYSLTPGAAGTPPLRWPTASQIYAAHDHLTLLMVIHPQCPCTRASLGELAIVMAHAGANMQAYVVFVRPPGLSDRLVHSDLWSAARAIPGVTAILDDGTEARRFGAATSGQTMVYDGSGRLLFSGGITAARGHWGDNLGASAIVGLLETAEPVVPAKSAVFGCALFAPDGSRRAEDRICPR